MQIVTGLSLEAFHPPLDAPALISISKYTSTRPVVQQRQDSEMRR